MFSQSDIGGDSSGDYATDLLELETDGLIDTVLGKGEKSGYVFVLSSPNQARGARRLGPPMLWPVCDTSTPTKPGSSVPVSAATASWKRGKRAIRRVE